MRSSYYYLSHQIYSLVYCHPLHHLLLSSCPSRPSALGQSHEGRVVVQFIDFGNNETKEEMELYDIPEEIGSQPAAAVGVGLTNDLEETDDNRAVVEDKLDGESLTVITTEDVVVFKISGEEVVFNQAAANTSSITTASEEMISMQDIKQSFSPHIQQPSVANHEVPAAVSFAEVSSAVGASSEVPVAALSCFEAPSQMRTNPLPAVMSGPPVLTSKVKQIEVAACKATVPIPAPSQFPPEPLPRLSQLCSHSCCPGQGPVQGAARRAR